MPILNAELHPDGPIIRIAVLVSQQRREALLRGNHSVPDPVILDALIDTGASSTMVDQVVIEQLAIPPSGATVIGTAASTSHACVQYDAGVAIILDNGEYYLVDNLPIVCSPQPLKPFGFQALLGQDILRHGMLILNGRRGAVTLAF